MKTIQDVYILVSPNGHINLTKIGTVKQEIIDEFLAEERTVTLIARVGGHNRSTPSWEHYEAEGYKIVKVDLVPVEPSTPDTEALP